MPTPAPTPPLPSARTLRGSRVAALALAGALLFGLAIDADRERATLFGLEGPHCLVAELAGRGACPACGLTRSASLTLAGAWRDACATHPAGPLVVLLCAAGLAVHLDVLRRGQRTRRHAALLSGGALAFALALASSWLARLF